MLGLHVGSTSTLLYLDLFFADLLNILLELFKLILLRDHELMYAVILKP